MQGLRGDPVAEARALENVISFHQDYLTYKPPLPPPLPLALVAKAYKELGAVRVRQGPDYFVSLPCISACTHVRRGGGGHFMRRGCLACPSATTGLVGMAGCHYWSCWCQGNSCTWKGHATKCGRAVFGAAELLCGPPPPPGSYPCRVPGHHCGPGAILVRGEQAGSRAL